MSVIVNENTQIDVQALNEDIKLFPQVHPITSEMSITHEGVSRLVMLDRYAFKDTEKKTLKQGDFVVLTVKPDPKFPASAAGGFPYSLLSRPSQSAPRAATYRYDCFPLSASASPGGPPSPAAGL